MYHVPALAQADGLAQLLGLGPGVDLPAQDADLLRILAKHLVLVRRGAHALHDRLRPLAASEAELHAHIDAGLLGGGRCITSHRRRGHSEPCAEDW